MFLIDTQTSCKQLCWLKNVCKITNYQSAHKKKHKEILNTFKQTAAVMVYNTDI